MDGQPGCELLEASDHQPHFVEKITVDGVFILHAHIPKADSLVPQHSHVYDHTTIVAAGRVKVWEDNVLIDEFAAPASILIKAGTKHEFRTLEDDTVLLCVHNVSRTGQVEVAEENQIVGKEPCHSV